MQTSNSLCTKYIRLISAVAKRGPNRKHPKIYSVYSVIFSIRTVATSPRDAQILRQTGGSLFGFEICLNYMHIGIL